MNLDIFNTIINIIYTSLCILVSLNLEDLLLKTISKFIPDLTFENRIIAKENNNSKLIYFSFKN